MASLICTLSFPCQRSIDHGKSGSCKKYVCQECLKPWAKADYLSIRKNAKNSLNKRQGLSLLHNFTKAGSELFWSW